METAYAVQLCLSVLLLSSMVTSASQVEKLPSNLHFDQAPRPATRPLDILAVSLSAWGHVNPILAVSEELVARGHRVTLCVGIDDEHKQKLEEKVKAAGVNFCRFSNDLLVIMSNLENETLYTQLDVLGNALANYSAETMLHVSQSFSNKSFDLVAGTQFETPMLKCFSSFWNIPVVAVGTAMQVFSHLQPPWAWPGVFLSSSSADLTFTQRAVSVIERFIFPTLFATMIISPAKASLHSFCPSVTLNEMAFSPGVTIPYFVPTVMGFDYPRLKYPMVEYVGPLLSRSPLPLSGEIEDWLTSKPDHSVVYISMGSLFELNRASGAALLHGVMQTNYSLLWSLRKSNQWALGGLEIDSSRVLISEWTPQLSVLRSKAIHSAILHGGFNGLNEALSSGVPVMGFPLMSEQAANIGRLHHNKIGLELDVEKITSSAVTDAIIEIGKFRHNSTKLQKLFKFAGGVTRVAELIEYYEEVGYDHLIPAYAKYNWTTVQYYNLDVYAVLLMVAGVILTCCVALLRCFLRRVAAKCCKPKVKAE